MRNIMTIKISSVLLTSTLFAGCIGKTGFSGDDSSKGAAGAANASAETAAGETPPPPPGMTGSGQAEVQAIDKQLKGLKEQLRLQAMVADFENKLLAFEDGPFAAFVKAVGGMTKVTDGFAAQIETSKSELQAAQIKKQQEAERLLELLKATAKEREWSRLQLLSELEALELALLDPLTAEGVSAQVAWDAYLAKLDVVREQSVLSEIEATGAAMKQAISALLVADKAAMNSLVDEIVRVNNELVRASAAANAHRVLQSLVDLELGLRAISPSDTAGIAAMQERINAVEQGLKMPLDALDANIFPQVVGLVTNIKTAEGMIAGFGAGLASLKELHAARVAAATALERQLVQAQTAAVALRVRPVQWAANGAIIGASLGASTVVLERLGAGMEALAQGLNAALAGDLSQGVSEESLAKLVQGEKQLEAGLGLLAGSLHGLGLLADAKAECSSGAVSLVGEIPTTDVTCGETFVVITSP